MTQRSALITGIHTGLGYALATHCIGQGWRVYGLSRTLPGDLVAHPQLRFAPLDLRRHDTIPRVLDSLLIGVDSLDLAVLNAGVLGEIKDLMDTSLAEVRDVMDVNVWANKILLDTLFGGYRVSQVIAISSGSAFNGSGGWGAYSISKSALNLLVRVYAHEHPETHFAAVAPGVVHTPMLDTVLMMPDNPRYAANGRIRAAMEESRVLPAENAAANIMARLDDLLNRPSGAYVDIRQL